MANLIIKPTSGGSLIFQDEGGTAAVSIDSSGDTTLAGATNNLGTVTAGTFEGTLNNTTTFAGAALGQFMVKAWCSFQGEQTVKIWDDYNISSITDGGTGTYTVNIDTDMATTNYCFIGNGGNVGGGTTLGDPEDRSVALGGTVAVGSFQVRTVNMSNQNYDTKRVSVLLFHD